MTNGDLLSQFDDVSSHMRLSPAMSCANEMMGGALTSAAVKVICVLSPKTRVRVVTTSTEGTMLLACAGRGTALDKLGIVVKTGATPCSDGAGSIEECAGRGVSEERGDRAVIRLLAGSTMCERS